MRKKTIIFIVIILILSLLTSACSSIESAYTKYSYEFVGAFDTTIQIVGYAKDEDSFKQMVDIAQERFMQLHRLFDIYNDYKDLNNAKTINDNAGIKAVKVPQELIDLLEITKKWYDSTNSKCNIAMGSVLKIWHDYRSDGTKNPSTARLPSITELNEAMKYTHMENIIIDTENSTVFLDVENMSLDLGAVAKGFASELVINELVEQGYSNFIINSGGNVKAVGEPLERNRAKWGIAVQDPFGNPHDSNQPHLDVLFLNDSSVVTSGDYQRLYTVNGQKYHHIIDPDTLMPANYFKSITVITQDSGFADFMSTTLFLLPYEEGLKLANQFDIAVIWVMHDGQISVTESARILMRDLGRASNKE